ncbi:hypothetical protein JD844_018035 [Phrynosoma platyrhinos]|uniref:Cytochrome P450 4B1 n=1 Tax=Phrynosoma platyrhinos TaxID=52577 RepID=A0ABQ7SMR6_PHRPL|nr:hypothetical protein JD844_018035 [Phrynosoma platyrhinos]
MDLTRLWHLVAVFCLTCLLLKALQLHRRRQELLKALGSFPGPPTHWLYGHIFELSSISTVFKKSEAWLSRYPYAFPLWFGRFSACVIINHPEYAKTLLARGDPKDNVSYRNIVPWIGKGLLVLHGPKWSQHRKMLTPGFHYNILKPYVTLMAESTKVMLDKWEQLITQQKSVELFEHVSLMTLDSIMKCAFSHNSNCQMGRDNSYVKAVFELCSLEYERLNSILGQSDLIYWFTPQGYRFRKACQVAHLHTEKIIKVRKESLGDEEELQKIQQKRYLDFLDILLCAKDENGIGLSDEDVRAEVDTFMFEGHDTTASGISWLLYCLAVNPEHQKRCREEIKSILGDHGSIEWDDLSKMTYCTLCIKESLRLYPPVPGVSRELTKPITFFDGRTLPEGVNCIGQQFAMNEMKVALALTLPRFELSPDPSKPPPVPIPQIVMRSLNGIHLCLKKIM